VSFKDEIFLRGIEYIAQKIYIHNSQRIINIISISEIIISSLEFIGSIFALGLHVVRTSNRAHFLFLTQSKLLINEESINFNLKI